MILWLHVVNVSAIYALLHVTGIVHTYMMCSIYKATQIDILPLPAVFNFDIVELAFMIETPPN